MVDQQPPPPTGSTPPTNGSTPLDPSVVRVGDTERNAAVAALGEHMSTGRLDLDEFGTRSAKASSARTVGELRELFTDLPAPHPPLPGGAAAVAPLSYQAVGTAVPVTGNTPALVDDRTRAQRLVAAAAGAAGVIAVILFFATGAWWWFLLIPLISSVAGGLWGESWKRPDSRG